MVTVSPSLICLLYLLGALTPTFMWELGDAPIVAVPTIGTATSILSLCGQ